jgi:alcohol dehydrogenase class IV
MVEGYLYSGSKKITATMMVMAIRAMPDHFGRPYAEHHDLAAEQRLASMFLEAGWVA